RLERRLQATVWTDFYRRSHPRGWAVVALPSRPAIRHAHHRSCRGWCGRNLCVDERDLGSLRHHRQGPAAGRASLNPVGLRPSALELLAPCQYRLDRQGPRSARAPMPGRLAFARPEKPINVLAMPQWFGSMRGGLLIATLPWGGPRARWV